MLIFSTEILHYNSKEKERKSPSQRNGRLKQMSILYSNVNSSWLILLILVLVLVLLLLFCALLFMITRKNQSWTRRTHIYVINLERINSYSPSLQPKNSALMEIWPDQLSGWIRTNRAMIGGSRIWLTTVDLSVFPAKTFKGTHKWNVRQDDC